MEEEHPGSERQDEPRVLRKYAAEEKKVPSWLPILTTVIAGLLVFGVCCGGGIVMFSTTPAKLMMLLTRNQNMSIKGGTSSTAGKSPEEKVLKQLRILNMATISYAVDRGTPPHSPAALSHYLPDPTLADFIDNDLPYHGVRYKMVFSDTNAPTPVIGFYAIPEDMEELPYFYFISTELGGRIFSISVEYYTDEPEDIIYKDEIEDIGWEPVW